MIKLTALLVLSAVVVGFVLIKNMFSYLKSKRKLKANELLLANGNIIEVPLSDCDIKSGQLYSDDESFSTPSRAEMVDALFGKQKEQPAPSTATYIIYTWRDSGGSSRRFISSPIFMPPESLRLRLDNQHYTNIYVDPANINNYFFDIRFLYNMD